MNIFRSSLFPYIHPYLQGPSRKQKTEKILVLKGGSPPFYLKGRHKPYYLPVTATNYCWLPGSASTSTRMNGQTQASLSFYKDLLLLLLTFTHPVFTSITPLTPRWPIWQQLLRQTPPKVGVNVKNWSKLVMFNSHFGLWELGVYVRVKVRHKVM